MKKNILFAVMMMVTCCATAQIFTTNVSIKGGASPLSTLSINSSGSSEHQVFVAATDKGLKATRNGSTTTWGTAIEGFSSVAGTTYCAGIHGYAYSGNSTAGRAYGVLGRGGYATSGYNYGVFGQLIGGGNGAGVYGTDSSYDFGTNVGDHPYAGYFNGSVRITSNLTVFGSINGTITGTGLNVKFPQERIATTSVDNVSEQFRSLNACSYYKEDYRDSTFKLAGDTLSEMRPLSFFQTQDISKQHYALSADDLEKLFPDLVYDEEDGSKSINYIEMIPLLVQAIGELKSEINRLNNCYQMHIKRFTTELEEIGTESIKYALEQNMPNPFSSSTSIGIFLPETTREATLLICDLDGKMLQKKALTKRGKFVETISLNAYEEGLYLYSLIADGVLLQTKRMLFEKK